MFFEFINTMNGSKHKLLSLSNLPLLSYQPLSFLGKMYPSPIVGNPLIKAGGRTFQKLSHLRGVWHFFLESGDKPEKEGLM